MTISSCTDTTTTSNKHPSREPLWVETDADGNLIVHSVIPEGISIGSGLYGRCLIATRPFAKGSIMYTGCCAFVDNALLKDSSYTLRLYRETGEVVSSFTLDEVNSVLDSAGDTRQFYGFDGFTNHCCDPNMHCPGTYKTKNLWYYKSIAIRDIAVGDEITADYAAFDYECDGHEILQCGCGAEKCRGSMRGFKHLTLDEKVEIMRYCDQEVIDTFQRKNPDIVILRSELPEGVALAEEGSNQTYLVASRQYEAGEVVYSNQAMIIPKEDMVGKTYILKIVGSSQDHYVRVHPHEHFVHRPSYCENLGFDSLMDHHCDPNCDHVYDSSSSYKMRAKRTILPGDKITCDYQALDHPLDELESLPTIEFMCKCGADSCRGLIVA